MENSILLLMTGIYVFFALIQMLVFADVILSWLRLAGINFRPQLISNVIDPIYIGIKKIIPTTIGPLELSPIIVIIITEIIGVIITSNFPQIGAIFTISI